MTYRFNGSYRHMPKLHAKMVNGHRVEYGPRGVLREMKAQRRLEAELRNLETPHEHTKAHRLNRCDRRACAVDA